jgi:hypothetical protein
LHQGDPIVIEGKKRSLQNVAAGYYTMAGKIGMAKPRRLLLVLIIPIALLALFLGTAKYGDDGHGIHYVSHAPFVTVSWGPFRRYIVQSGVNVVWDRPNAQSGNFIEFPIAPETRVSLRLFSGHWIREELHGWLSNHKAIKVWLLNHETIAWWHGFAGVPEFRHAG